MVKRSLKVPVLDLSGKKVKEIDLPSDIFAAKINAPLMAQAVRVYLSNQRKAFAKVKTRAEVRGSGRKIWRQKGTGNARHGDRYAPIFVGGGKAHGPRGNQAYHLTLPKKMRKKALASALTAKLNEGKVIVISGLEKLKPKTKKGEQLITKVIGQDFNKSRVYLLILPEMWPKTKRGLGNLPYLDLSLLSGLNSYLVLRHDYLIFALEALKGWPKKESKKEKNG